MGDVTGSAATTDAETGSPDDVDGLAALLIPPGSRVLDLGCDCGRLSELLKANGCSVVGVDIDRQTLEADAPGLERVVDVDVESPKARLDRITDQFDAICLLDVLGRVRQPEEVLRWAGKLLQRDGIVLVSLPNVTHVAVTVQMMSGRFERRDRGLLDRGHLHLYDRVGAESLLMDAGLEIVERLRIRRNLDETEIKLDLSRIPAGLVDEAIRQPDALTYQFFFVAAPSLLPQSASGLASQLQTRLERCEDALEQATSHARHIEQQLAEKSACLEELKSTVQLATERLAETEQFASELREAMAERMMELTDRAAEVRALAADLDLKERYGLRLRAEIDAAAAHVANVEESYRLRLRAEMESAAAQIAHVEDAHRNGVAELERLLQATTSRAGYRVMERLHDALGIVPGAQPLGRWMARRLAR